MAVPNITELLNASQAAFNESVSGNAQIQETRRTQQKMSEKIAQGQEAEGRAKATVISAEQAGILQSTAARLKAGAIFGADLNQQGEKLSRLAEIQAQTMEQRLNLSQEIAAKQSVSFLDNPLEYIVNQFTVGGDIAKYNALADVEDNVTRGIEDITRLSSGVAQNQKNFEVTVTQASADAKAQEALQASQNQADATRMTGLNYNVDAVTAAMNASRDQMNIRYQTNQARNTQEQLALQMAEHALRVQEAKYRQEERATAKETDEYMMARLNDGYKVLYGEKYQDFVKPGQLKQMLSLMKSNTIAGQEANRVYMAGVSGVVAGNPAQVIDMVGRGLPVEFTPAQGSVKKLFESAVQAVKSTGVPIKDDTERQNVVNAAVTGQLKKMSAEVKATDPENIFQIGDVRTLIQLPGVSDTALVQKVLGSSQVDVNNPKMVYSEALRGVKEGKLTVDQAVDGIVALYGKGVSTNIAAKNLPRLGIAPSPKEVDLSAYNTAVEVAPGALWGKEKVVNLNNRNDVARAVLKTLGLSYASDPLVKSIGVK